MLSLSQLNMFLNQRKVLTFEKIFRVRRLEFLTKRVLKIKCFSPEETKIFPLKFARKQTLETLLKTVFITSRRLPK